MKYYDVTVPIDEKMHIWSSHEKVKIEDFKSIDKGSSSNIKKLSLFTHTGTHIDFPLHMIEKGLSLDDFPPEIFFGQVQVTEVLNPICVTKDDIEGKISDGIEKIFFKTKNTEILAESPSGFFSDYIYIAKDAADYLIEKNVKLVGIDYLSVDSADDGNYTVHKTLMKNGALIVEYLKLDGVQEGIYNLHCAPLKIAGADGAPARVVLSK